MKTLFFWHYRHFSNQGEAPWSAMQEGQWELLQFYGNNHVEFYNLNNDIEEQNDLPVVPPDMTAHMLFTLNQ